MRTRCNRKLVRTHLCSRCHLGRSCMAYGVVGGPRILVWVNALRRRRHVSTARTCYSFSMLRLNSQVCEPHTNPYRACLHLLRTASVSSHVGRLVQTL